MGRLKTQFTNTFIRDAKRLREKHIDDTPLAEVIDLIVENTPETLEELRGDTACTR
jgi:toxin-antitoxin system, toxin component, relE family